MGRILLGGSLVAVVWFIRWVFRPAGECLRSVNEPAMMFPMYASTDRLVLVPATQLDDLLELTRLLADRLPEHDPLRSSLVGATAQVRASALAEP